MNITLQERLLKATGESGVKLTDVQGLQDVSASYINALEDSVIDVKVDWVNAADVERLNLDKGQTVFGSFTEITVVSGAVVAY